MDPAPLAHPHRPKFKLLAPHLSGDDHARLAMFVRVAGDRLRGDWNVVSDGNGHLLLLDREDDVTVSGMMDPPVSTMRLSNGTPSELAEEGILFRPLQYDALIEALLTVERQVLAPVPAAAPAGPTQRVREELARLQQPPAQAQVRAVVPAAPIESKAAAAPVGELRLAAGDTFRLRRWPALALLKKHRYNGRLASFLSVRHVELNDLLRLSNVEQEHCLQFLQALHAAGVLDVKRAPPKAPANKPVAAPAPAPVDAAPPSRPASTVRKPAPVEVGLFAKLRRHLGIA